MHFTTNNHLRFRLVGPFSLKDQNGNDLTPRGRKARALLAILALSPGATRTRTWLARTLWPDRSEYQAAGSLRQTIAEIRRSLGEKSEFIISDRQLLGLQANSFVTDIQHDLFSLERIQQKPNELLEEMEMLEGLDVRNNVFVNWLRETRAQVAGRSFTSSAVSDEKPSPTKFLVEDDRLDVDEQTSKSEGYPSLKSAWQAISQTVEDNVEHLSNTNTPRILRVLLRCQTALGSSYDLFEPLALGVHSQRLEEIARRADDILLETDAADLKALSAQVTLFLAQFEEWESYRMSIQPGFGSLEEEKKSVEVADELLAQFHRVTPDLFSKRAKDTIEPIRDAAVEDLKEASPELESVQVQRRSFLRTIRSALQAIARNALDVVRTGIKKGLEKQVSAVTVAGVTLTSGYLLALAELLPLEFGWLAGAVAYVTKLAGKG